MVRLENIQITYGKFDAVQDLDLSISKGEFFTFLGASGCGKTSVLRAIAGFITPVKGRVFINDKDVTHVRPEDRRIGIVFQNYALFPHMSVRQNIGFGLKVKRISKTAIKEKTDYYARIAGIENILDKSVAQISGGQQQRVAIARSLAIEPELLLLDEPLSNLDAKLRLSMRKELKRLQKELGITTLYVTHDQEEALEVSDKIAVFSVGKIEQIGTPQEIYREPSNLSVCQFIGESNRLEHSFLKKIREMVPEFHYEENRSYYIRKERIQVQNRKTAEDALCFPAKIIESSYTGMLYKLKIRCFEQILEVFEFDSSHISASQNVDIHINFSTEDILEFSHE